ncbi:MAG: Sialic acid TRAP transporter permease protein SiaT [Syntrophaceae bacterium PtaU1.Bin231]|nr:MAG: Sialic acid TRAP transporter permease protein SiaT [Syntrophaceae bacterium PtaU1.Bin231]HOG17274.1 TRAP transporter large permease subunit [Syntrophales bacterium]
MSVEMSLVVLFGSLIAFLVMGMPIAYATGASGMIGLLIIWGPSNTFLVAARALQNMNSYTLVALAPFIMMGMVLERSGIGRELFDCVYQWAGSFRGSLAVTTIIVCAIMAAMTGVVGAAVTTVGLIALPAMLKQNYNKHVSLGACCAGGSLGVLIPPSVIFIIYGACTNISVGKLFMGGFATGGLLALMYIAYIVIRSYMQHDFAPPLHKDDQLPLAGKIRLLKGVIAPVVIVIIVLGVIFGGFCTPTEAAGVGAVASLIFAAMRPGFTWAMFKGILLDTVKATCMVMWIIFGSSFFVAVFAGSGGSSLVENLLLTGVGNRWVTVCIIMVILFILGCFMDTIAIVLLCAPIFTSIITALKFDPIWFGILFNVNLQMAYISPPFGYSLFYLKGVSPRGITTGDIYRSVWPFIGVQIVCILLLIKWPFLCTWLADIMIK